LGKYNLSRFANLSFLKSTKFKFMKKVFSFRLLALSFIILLSSAGCGSTSNLLDQGSSLMSALGGNSSLSTFTSLLKTPGLNSLLGGALKGPTTLLAPTNDAFNALPASTLTDLKNPSNVQQIASLVKNSIIPGKKDPSTLKNGGITTAAGTPLNFSGINAGSLVQAGDVNIIPIDKVLQ
jgi:uncharacterized surface protein with fasciclin (FAS1) repeats